MISKQEKKLIHIYAHAASLAEAEYRSLLQSVTGLDSSADDVFRHRDADAVLAALEGVLFDRVAVGRVPDPRSRSRWIRDEYHFRKRLRDGRAMSVRQEHEILRAWELLLRYLPRDQRTPAYLSGICRRALGADVPFEALSSAQAAIVLTAVRERCNASIRRSTVSENPVAPQSAASQRFTLDLPGTP